MQKNKEWWQRILYLETIKARRGSSKILKVLCQPKFDNLDKNDKFLERYKWPKLTHEERDNLNSFISIK